MEVMIVLLIISIVAAMAVARLGDTAASRLRSAAQTLVADLGYAQVESIGHGDDPRVVVFDLVHHRYHIAPAAQSATPITHPISKAPYRVTFGQGAANVLAGVTIAAVSVGGDDQLQFGAYGQLDQAVAATITLAAGGHRVTITIDPVSGEATIGGFH